MAGIDFTQPMQQTFEYWVVDPKTWKDESKIPNVISATLEFDLESDTLGRATLEAESSIGESYFRAYLVATQGELTERFPLGTYLVETPTLSFDGRSQTCSMEAYTPLLELSDDFPALGFSIPKESNVLEVAARLAAQHARAPVIATESDKLIYEDFVAEPDDTWLSYLSDLLAKANYRFLITPRGEITFAPVRDANAMTATQTFDDGNSSILYPDVEEERDLYGVPNVYEVIYSRNGISKSLELVNNDALSDLSYARRGRYIRTRDTSPEISDNPSEAELKVYARRKLRDESNLERSISYSHGYCGNLIGDAVHLQYTRAGIDTRAVVTTQSITCEPGCKVEETAKYSQAFYD